MSRVLQHTLTALTKSLPRGGLLPEAAWRHRHRGIVALLWLHVCGFAAYGLLSRDATAVCAVGLLAALATWPRGGRIARTLFASAGLVTSSALLLHLSSELRLHFFVVVAVIALYEDWLPFLLALGYVMLAHALVGSLVQDGFVLAVCAASLVHWRLSEKERESASSEQRTLAEQAILLDLTQDGMFVWDLESGAIQFWNHGAEELYGWTRDEVLGRTPQEILRTEFPRPLAELREALESTGRWEGELVHRRRDGSRVVVNSRWALKNSADGRPNTALAINSNITEQKRAQAELEHQARHDALTGLPNRITLATHLREALRVGATDGAPVALLMLDLDRFKDVNDTLGHAAGDRLLRDVGARLSARLRAGDTLARLGGDEFAVLLPGASASAAQLVAGKLLDGLEQPFDLGGASVNVAASIGIAVFPEHGGNAETLLRRADVAMYVAKRGSSGAAVYLPEQDQHNRDRLAVASDLRRAIQDGELVLHYQPKLACASGEVVGAEALVRWQHPERGLVPPDQFIPVAEQSGLIGLLGRRVLELALRDARAWRDNGISIPVAVNLSMRDMLDPDLPGFIERLLSDLEVEATCLRVEITESSLMVDPVRSHATLMRLCELGVRLSVDDYGTGYSSLRYLQQLPLDELKIDRSFIRDMVCNENDLMIVQSTIDLAHGLNLSVVAEGVEDAGTWQRLAEIGCDQAQGYHLCRPIPVERLTHWLLTSKPGQGSQLAA